MQTHSKHSRDVCPFLPAKERTSPGRPRFPDAKANLEYMVTLPGRVCTSRRIPWQKTRLDSEIEKILQEKRVKALRGFSRLSSEGEVIAASNES